LKEVIYGSCQLLPLKAIKTECKKLAGDFNHELINTLASEMDPNVVCTVSGLCNNARIDKLLLKNKRKVTTLFKNIIFSSVLTKLVLCRNNQKLTVNSTNVNNVLLLWTKVNI